MTTEAIQEAADIQVAAIVVKREAEEVAAGTGVEVMEETIVMEAVVGGDAAGFRCRSLIRR